jgi:DNA-binding NtrC family response regulator
MSDKLNILVVDDDHSMARTLGDILSVKGFQAELAYSGEEAIESVQTKAFDCVLTDIKMPGLNGVELHRVIKRDHPETPVVLMTAYATDALVDKGLEEGAIAALTKPLDINMLLGFISSLRKDRSVVIIDDDPVFCEMLRGVLEERKYDVVSITAPEQFPEVIDQSEDVIVLLDMKFKTTDGLEVMRQIIQEKGFVPIILMTGYHELMTDAIKAALELGAHACLNKPFQIEELLQMINEARHKEMKKRLN